eukprot:2446539-Rhodomonas_salina.1
MQSAMPKRATAKGASLFDSRPSADLPDCLRPGSNPNGRRVCGGHPQLRRQRHVLEHKRELHVRVQHRIRR